MNVQDITLGLKVRTPGQFGFDGKVTRIVNGDPGWFWITVTDRTGDSEEFLTKEGETWKVR